MPFTLSHPAIILPFGFKQHKYIDFTTLFIGALSPDFEYYIHLRPIRFVGHTILGQLYFNLPLIIIAAFILHFIIKKPLIIHLPKPFCNRYYYLVKRKWIPRSAFRWLVVCYSGLIGAFSHLLWDSFTHRSGFFVQKIKVLTHAIIFFNRTIPIYNLIQHISSIGGLIAIGLFILHVQDRHSKYTLQADKHHKAMFWGGVCFLSIIVLSIELLYVKSIILSGLIVITINAVVIGVIGMSLIARSFKIMKKA